MKELQELLGRIRWVGLGNADGCVLGHIEPKINVLFRIQNNRHAVMDSGNIARSMGGEDTIRINQGLAIFGLPNIVNGSHPNESTVLVMDVIGLFDSAFFPPLIISLSNSHTSASIN
jgi:hypothetical protein